MPWNFNTDSRTASPLTIASNGGKFSPRPKSPGSWRVCSGRFPAEYVLLDPGAGIGTLTAAFCERVGKLRSPRTVTAHLFENDPELTPLLQANMDHCKRVLSEAGHTFNYVLHAEDFILAASHGLGGSDFSMRRVSAWNVTA